MATQNFKVDVSDFLGFNYSKHLETLAGVSISNPKLFYEMRQAVQEKVRNEIVESWFAIFYEVLTVGKIKGVKLHDELGEPSYPSQETSKMALGIGRTISKIADEIVEVIIPDKYLAMAKSRTQDKANAMGL